MSQEQEKKQEPQDPLKQAWEGMGDWWGRCRRCGEKVSGTPKALREHKCGEQK